MVVCWTWSSAAGELRLEAESAKLLPAAGGGRAFVSKVIGPSGTPVVGSFERGAVLAFGATPAAKWLHAVFATNSTDSRFRKDFGLEPAYVEFFDGTNRILHGILVPGASIGMHTHETNSEILFVLAGHGTLIEDGVSHPIHLGQCTYCPKGHTHSLINTSEEQDLEFYAVIPEQ